jgi:hypothetical protein
MRSPILFLVNRPETTRRVERTRGITQVGLTQATRRYRSTCL